ncbi:hypothetical protein BGZ72_005100 [Mortierella alpina]|nr:hypothetical protein BGZ72_005100 [Mortierella alpina]
MTSPSVMEQVIGKTQLPPSLQEGFVIQTLKTLNNNHTSAPTSLSASSKSRTFDRASPYSSPEPTSLELKFADLLNLSPSLAKDKLDTQDMIKTTYKVKQPVKAAGGNVDCVVNVSSLHDSFGSFDTVNRQDLPTPSPSPSLSIKTPICYSYFYGSEHDSGQDYEGTAYDWGEGMVVFEQYDRYGDAIFSSSLPYVPFDYNTLNPDLDPDDSNYYVHVPEYEYVTLSDGDVTMSKVENDYQNDDMFELESNRCMEE